MTAEQLIRLLLELDQQCLASRPSAWGKAAELVRDLAEHAEPSFRDERRLGDFRSIDLSAVHRPAPRDLDQPTLDRIQREEDSRAELLEACEEALIVVDDAYEKTGYFRVAKSSHQRMKIEAAIANAKGERS